MSIKMNLEYLLNLNSLYQTIVCIHLLNKPSSIGKILIHVVFKPQSNPRRKLVKALIFKDLQKKNTSENCTHTFQRK